MTKRFSVLILYSRPKLSLSVSRCLSQIPGIRIHALSFEGPNMLRFSRSVSSFHSMRSWGDPQRQLEIVSALAKRFHTDVILPVDEDVIPWASSHRDELTSIAALAPVPDPSIYQEVVGKFGLAGFLSRNSFPRPATIQFTGIDGMPETLDDFHFPVLLKPSVGLGGKGILVFEDRDSLMNYLRANKQLEGAAVIQEHIDGYDIGCSVLASEGKVLALTIQKGIVPGVAPFSPPDCVEFVAHEELAEIAHRGVEVSRWNGIANVDCKFDKRDGHIKVLEVNPRFWLSVLGSLAMGINFPYLSCMTALGESFPVPTYHHGRYIVAPRVAMKNVFRRQIDADSSCLRYMVRDPLPEVLEGMGRAVNGNG